MILMSVVAPMSENQIWRDSALQLFKTIFHCGSTVGQETVAEFFQQHLAFRSAGKKFSAFLRFARASARGREYDPAEFQFGITFLQLQQRSAAADFNVVGVRSQAKDLQRSLFLKLQPHHAVTPLA